MNLDEFYKIIEKNRDEHYGQKHGEEPRELRNPMVQFLIDNLPENSVVSDLFSGDGVVPLAVGYLQKKQDSNKLSKLYAFDDNSDKAADLIEKNHKSLGLDFELVHLNGLEGVIGMGDRDFKKDQPDTTALTLIEGLGYLASLYGSLSEALDTFFDEVRGIDDIYICQVKIPFRVGDFCDTLDRKLKDKPGYEVVKKEVHDAGKTEVYCWHLKPKD